MNKVSLLVISIASLTFTSGFSQPVKEHGKLSVHGTYLTDEHNRVVVLQGVCYGWTNWWPRFYTKESVKWLADDWKCSVVRAAMGVSSILRRRLRRVKPSFAVGFGG